MISDWQAIGFEDGSRGYTAGQFSKRRKACAKFGVTPDFQSYQSGRQQGLVEYCKPNRGYRLGAQGKSYQGVCPTELEADFLVAYRAGKRLYRMEADIKSLSNQIHRSEKELNASKERLVTASEQLVSNQTSTRTRELLLVEILQLNEKQEELEEDIVRLERQKYKLELEHAKYKKLHARFSY